MSAYLLLASEDERAHAAQSPHDIADTIARRAAFADRLQRGGWLRDHGRFRPSKEGKRVRASGVEDGPFAGDGGRALAGYYWIEAPSLDEAVRLAAEYPALGGDDVDVRPLAKGIAVPDKDARPGKVFAFAVLGAAVSEEAWVGVMDRIDAETQDSFPAESFLGGNRLAAPRAGRHAATAERRAAFDGPFLEAKEVIGGVFFLRMLSIEDAVRWAAASRFVIHGALEIRELWRS